LLCREGLILETYGASKISEDISSFSILSDFSSFLSNSKKAISISSFFHLFSKRDFMICSFLRRLEAGIQYNQLRMRWWTWQFLIRFINRMIKIN
jgi:hypothetical protein